MIYDFTIITDIRKLQQNHDKFSPDFVTHSIGQKLHSWQNVKSFSLKGLFNNVFLYVYLQQHLQQNFALCLSDVKSSRGSQQEELFTENALKFINKSLKSTFYGVQFLRKLQGVGVQL